MRKGQIRASREFDSADPTRRIDHPSHKEQWLALARALGRLDAKRDFEIIHGKGGTVDKTKTRNSKPDT